MKKYVLGIDFGTLSGRALLVDAADGTEAAASVYEYPHAVMEDEACGVKLSSGWALQDPQDYLDVLEHTIPAVLDKAGAKPEQIAGIGIDFTACTLLPVKADGTPLCFMEDYRKNPHALVKLWKSHAAHKQADRLNEVMEKMDPDRLKRFGGRVSSEWMLPKIMHTLDEAPEVYAAADRFVEAGDWINWMLTGVCSRSTCAAGYKSMWADGDVSNDLLCVLDQRLDGLFGTKVHTEVLAQGALVGHVTKEAAARFGLVPGIPVSSCFIDAHAAFPGCGITTEGSMLLIIGTSSCHLLLGRTETLASGICGVVNGGAIPGYYAYEAGQSGVGDIFDWFVKRCLNGEYRDEAAARGISPHQLLREKASLKKPGESGLVALDWWNGNRSVLQDSTLSGMMVGLRMDTKPEDIYRALLEATAFGTKKILDNFEENGIPVGDIVASGGIAMKDELLMQIYADVTGRTLRVGASKQAGALGSAMSGAVAAGLYDSFDEAAKAMVKPAIKVYTPNPDNAKAYARLYEIYLELHDHFGRESDIMKRLHAMTQE